MSHLPLLNSSVDRVLGLLSAALSPQSAAILVEVTSLGLSLCALDGQSRRPSLLSNDVEANQISISDVAIAVAVGGRRVSTASSADRDTEKPFLKWRRFLTTVSKLAAENAIAERH